MTADDARSPAPRRIAATRREWRRAAAKARARAPAASAPRRSEDEGPWVHDGASIARSGAEKQNAALPRRSARHCAPSRGPLKRWPLARAGPVAQWLEPAAHNGLVGGSSPSRPTGDSAEFGAFQLSAISREFSEVAGRGLRIPVSARPVSGARDGFGLLSLAATFVFPRSAKGRGRDPVRNEPSGQQSRKRRRLQHVRWPERGGATMSSAYSSRRQGYPRDSARQEKCGPRRRGRRRRR